MSNHTPNATFGMSGKAAKRLLRDGPDAAIRKATEEIWHGDKWRALDMLTTIARAHTKDPRTVYFTGLALYDLGSLGGPASELRDRAWPLAENFMAYTVVLAERDPKHARLVGMAYYNLAKFLMDVGRLDEALEAARLANARNPGGPETWGMMGDLEAHNGDLTTARLCWEKAATVPTLNPESLYNRSFKRILLGDLAGGHADYEQRFACPGFAAEYKRDWWLECAQALPGDDGKLHFYWLQKSKRGAGSHHEEAIPDLCTLLLYAEQGHGDTIQALRYLPAVRDRFNFRGPIVLEVQREIVPLVETMGLERTTVIPRGEKLPGVHAWASIMSLTSMFDGETLGGAPYLRVTPDTPPNPFGLKRVGLCWAGSVGHKGDGFRSMPFKHALAFRDVPGVEWVSVQWGHREAEAGQITWLQRNHGRWADMMDTATVIAGLDLLVTIDSSVAHLAGALGVPTALMIPVVPDARWELGRSDSRWYDSVKIYRHHTPRDWDGTVRRVISDLTSGKLLQHNRRVA
jgi:tetratricopeptide (TPR) repeat protein